MKNLFRFAALLFVFGILVFPAPAQDDSVKTFEVRLPVTVKDKKKNLVSGFTKNDFIVLEDGVPQEADVFYGRKDESARLCRRFDGYVGFDERQTRFFKEAAMNFIYTVTRLRKIKPHL